MRLIASPVPPEPYDAVEEAVGVRPDENGVVIVRFPDRDPQSDRAQARMRKAVGALVEACPGITIAPDLEDRE